MPISIDLLAYQQQLVFKDENKERFIFCSIRKKYLVSTPEELVRQLFIIYLVDKGYSKGRIAVEKELSLHGQQKRFDLIVVNELGEPFILAEFKAPTVSITEQTLTQITNYNVSLQADELIISNGVLTYWFIRDKENSFKEKTSED